MSFESVYSMRFYELLSGQTNPISYTIEYLKDRFQIVDKYKQINDFVKRVIEPAKKELDEKSPYTFEYKINKTGRKFTSITFFPVYQPQFRNDDLERKELQKQVSPGMILGRQSTDYLKHSFDFTTAEIKQNLEIFTQASKKFDLIEFLSKVKPRANRANNPKGYVIASIKSQLKNF